MSELSKVISQIEAEMTAFIAEAQVSTKAASKRCRKATLTVAKLGKTYRKLSIAAEKK